VDGWDSDCDDPISLGDKMSDYVTIPPDPPPPCTLAAITTQRASVSKVKVKGDSYCELDYHADTCCFGPGAYIIHDTHQTISVNGFIESLGTLTNVPIVTAAVAYDCPSTLHTSISLPNDLLLLLLIIKEAAGQHLPRY
jgi:hypothetical protein